MKKKRLLLVAAVAAAMSITAGCGIKTDTPIIGKIAGLGSDEIFKVGELICPKEEYMLLFMNTQNQYKKDFGKGLDWNAAVTEDKTLQDVVREQAKEELSVIYGLAELAQEKQMSLSAEEQAAAESAAKEFYNGMTDEERDYTDSSLKDVENLYTKMLLAKKVKTDISKDAGKDISDEQARVIKIQYIHMSSKNQTQKKIRSTFDEVTSVVNGGYQEFIREAKQYSLDSDLELTLKKNEADKKFQQEAFNLNDGEISPMIQDGTDYYLVYCVSSYLEKETGQNKNALIEAAKQQALDAEYQKFLSSVKTDFNTSAWEKINVSTDAKVRTTELMQGIY